MSKLKSASNEVLLRRYISGEVGPLEEAELRARAIKDKALADALAGIDHQIEDDHEAAISRLRKRLPRQQAQTRRLNPTLRRVAAAALILAICGGVFWLLPLAEQSAEGATAMEMADEANTATEQYQKQIQTKTDDQTSAQTTGAERLREEATASPADPPEVADPIAAREPEQSVEESPSPSASMARVAEDEFAAAAPAPQIELSEDNPVLAETTPDEDAEGQLQQPTATATDRGRLRRWEESAADEAPPMPLAEQSELDQLLANSPNTVLIEGFVLDQDGISIPDAIVRMSSTPLGELTNTMGYFSFESDASVSSIIIEAPGYEATEFRLSRVGDSPNASLSNRANRPLSREEAFARGLKPDETSPLVVPQYTLSPISEVDGNRSDDSGLALTSLVRVEGGMQSLRQQIASGKPENLPNGRVRVIMSIQADGSIVSLRTRGANRALRQYVENYLLTQTRWEMIRGDETVDLNFNLRF